MPRIDHNDPGTWPIGETHYREGPNSITVNTNARDRKYSLDNETVQCVFEAIKPYLDQLEPKERVTSVVITSLMPETI